MLNYIMLNYMILYYIILYYIIYIPIESPLAIPVAYSEASSVWACLAPHTADRLQASSCLFSASKLFTISS